MTSTPASFQYRQCCTDGPASATAAFLEAVGKQGVGIGAVVAVASVEDEAPILSVAYHEASHAAVGYAVGLEVGDVVARNGGYAEVFGGAGHDWATLIMLAAGDFGGGIPSRWTYRPPDEVLLPWISAVRQCKMGFCDRCRILRSLIARTGHGPDRIILDEYRRLEADVLDLLNHPEIKAAIYALASELMQTGRLSAARVNEILEQHLEKRNA